MNIFINIAISITAGAGSAFAIIKFFGKKWIENIFAKKLKTYQAELDRVTNELKAKLKVEYENLQPGRMEAIRVLSILLLQLQDHLKYADINKCPSSTEEEAWVAKYVQTVVKNSNKLVAEIRNYNVLFSDETTGLLNDLKDAFMQFGDAYTFFCDSINEENFSDPDMSLSAFWYNKKSILIEAISSGNLEKLLSQFRDLNKANVL